MAVLRFVLFAVLAPILAVQALRTRRGTPRLPGASGPATGVTGSGTVVRLAVLGESTVAGVGARTHSEGLTGQLAQLLARAGLVRWQAVGRTGATAAIARRDLVPQLRPADLVVIALGVNDTLTLRSAARFRRDLLGVIVDVRHRLGPVPVVLAGVPPMGRFPALPRPLKDVLSARSAILDRAAIQLAVLPDVAHVPLPPELLHATTFAPDRFHPSPAGYRAWAASLVAATRGGAPSSAVSQLDDRVRAGGTLAGQSGHATAGVSTRGARSGASGSRGSPIRTAKTESLPKISALRVSGGAPVASYGAAEGKGRVNACRSERREDTDGSTGQHRRGAPGLRWWDDHAARRRARPVRRPGHREVARRAAAGSRGGCRRPSARWVSGEEPIGRGPWGSGPIGEGGERRPVWVGARAGRCTNPDQRIRTNE